MIRKGSASSSRCTLDRVTGSAPVIRES